MTDRPQPFQANAKLMPLLPLGVKEGLFTNLLYSSVILKIVKVNISLKNFVGFARVEQDFLIFCRFIDPQAVGIRNFN